MIHQPQEIYCRRYKLDQIRIIISQSEKKVPTTTTPKVNFANLHTKYQQKT